MLIGSHFLVWVDSRLDSLSMWRCLVGIDKWAPVMTYKKATLILGTEIPKAGKYGRAYQAIHSSGPQPSSCCGPCVRSPYSHFRTFRMSASVVLVSLYLSFIVCCLPVIWPFVSGCWKGKSRQTVTNVWDFSHGSTSLIAVSEHFATLIEHKVSCHLPISKELAILFNGNPS